MDGITFPENRKPLKANCIQNFHFGRNMVGYTVENSVLRRRIVYIFEAKMSRCNKLKLTPSRPIHLNLKQNECNKLKLT